MTLRRAIALGLIAGTTFCLGAAIADLIYMSRGPHPTRLTGPDGLFRTLRK